MQTFDEILSDLRRRTYTIDCFEMVLTQRATSAPISFRGKGFIRQTGDDTFEYTIYVTEIHNTDQWQWLHHTFSGKSGELFSDSDYFDLLTRDGNGYIWTSTRLIPHCNWRSEEPNPIINGTIDTLSTTRPPTPNVFSATIHFFETSELPLMNNKFEFSSDDYKFCVQKLDGEFSFEITSSCVLAEDVPGRVQEALRFLLAQSVSWRGLAICDGERDTLRLTAAVPQSRKTRLYPPIGRGKSHAHIADCWKMFLLYLCYVNRSSQSGYWNYASYHLHNACESSSNSFDAWSYGLSIAVEGLTALLPEKKDVKTKILLRNMNRSIITYVNDIGEYSALLKRLKGILGGMLNEPPPDRMYLLVDTGHLDADHIAAWKALRNKFVHPKQSDLKKIDDTHLQELITQIHKVTTLMYHIVFYIIGYEGKYTDYSEANFPDKTYPLL